MHRIHRGLVEGVREWRVARKYRWDCAGATNPSNPIASLDGLPTSPRPLNALKAKSSRPGRHWYMLVSITTVKLVIAFFVVRGVLSDFIERPEIPTKQGFVKYFEHLRPGQQLLEGVEAVAFLELLHLVR